ncbi:MAG: CatA-like O-acetyltransferase [Pseudoflavonifractor sp.]
MEHAPLQHKLEVLAQIARALNERQLTWAVGASLLLYFKGIVSDFHDIDLMVTEEDAPAARQALSALGQLQPPSPSAGYRTKIFLEFLIRDVEVDLMAGFVIVSGGEAHAFPLRKEDIRDCTHVGGEAVPLQALSQWRTCYALMGRTEKVQLIDRACTIERHGLDLTCSPRRAHFEYFRDMDYPYVGVTINVEITQWLQKIKAEQRPFFLSLLYEVAGAANAVPELRQRILGDGVVEFGHCPASYTLALEDGSYCYCTVDCRMPYGRFLPYALRQQADAAVQPSISDEDGGLPLLFISSAPWLSYTALVQPVPKPADSNPRITWGKYFTQEGKILLPVSLLCHHALVDGRHLAAFYETLNARLQAERPCDP